MIWALVMRLSEAGELVFFGSGFVGACAAVVEEFGEPGCSAPACAGGLDDGEQRSRDGIEAGFGNLLREFFVALHGVEEGDVVDAELGSGLAEGEAVGHQAEDAALGQIVELEGAAAADGAVGKSGRVGEGVSGSELFTGVLVGVVNNSGGFGGLDGDVLIGSDGYNENAVKGLWRWG